MPSAVWKKLNLKDEPRIAVWQAPASFEAEIATLDGVEVVRDLARAEGLSFLMAFVTRQDEVADVARRLSGLAAGDVVVWMCYPKGTSKRYTCSFNRDTGWEPLGAAGFEGVRMVAIDEDWSALRFRRVEYVKGMQRDPKRALTAEGKAATAKR